MNRTVMKAAIVSLSGLLTACNAVEPDELEIKQFALSNIDARRSLVVTEHQILARFPFKRVLDQLVAQSGVPGLTSLQLFHQWWDTQNPAPGLGLGRSCNTEVDAAGNPTVNGYPYACRPAATNQEGLEATTQPFDNPGDPDEYIPIGLFNRFDAAPGNGAHCGEHRIVYARRSGITAGLNRNLIIFEPTVPNPRPADGLRGCQSIVQFWADLTTKNNVEDRAKLLERFYFAGIGSVPAVISVGHFGSNAAGTGQIRTNQFMQADPLVTPKVWNLREFKLIRTCQGQSCTALKLVPVTDKTNPFGPLFSSTGTHPQTGAFQSHFVTQVSALAASALAKIDMKTPDVFNTAQSLASGSTENNYVTQFAGASTLRDNIQAALTSMGSSLTPDHIVARAQALSCAGCHRLNANPGAPGLPPIGGGLNWPASLGFTHVTENLTEAGDGGPRFVISPALIDSFLPVRKQIMDDYLDGRPTPNPDSADPIGGRRVH
jgi:hypothetical protein